MSLSKTVAASVRATFASAIASGVIQAVILVLLARLLGPREYGAAAIAVIVTSLTTTFAAQAIERGLVVLPAEEFSHDQFWTPAVFVTGLAAVVFAGDLAIQALGFHTGGNSLLLGVYLVANTFSSLAIGPRVVLRRRLSYGWLAIADIVAQVGGTGAIAVICAFLGMGSFALGMGAIGQAAILAGMTLWGARRETSLAFDLSGFHKMLASAWAISRIVGLEIFHGQIAGILLGRLFGVTVLGQYNRAYTVVTLPVQMLIASMNRVLLSGFVAVGGDTNRRRNGLSTLIKVTVAITGPVVGGMVGSIHELTLCVLGKNWVGIAPMAGIIVIASWSALIASLFLGLVDAARAFRRKTVVQVIFSTTTIALILIGLHWGILGSLTGIMIAGLLYLAMSGYLGASIVDIPFTGLAPWLWPGVSAAILCGLFAAGIHVFVRTSSFVALVIEIGGCGLLTVTYYLTFFRRLVAEILDRSGVKDIALRLGLGSA